MDSKLIEPPRSGFYFILLDLFRTHSIFEAILSGPFQEAEILRWRGYLSSSSSSTFSPLHKISKSLRYRPLAFWGLSRTLIIPTSFARAVAGLGLECNDTQVISRFFTLNVWLSCFDRSPWISGTIRDLDEYCTVLWNHRHLSCHVVLHSLISHHDRLWIRRASRRRWLATIPFYNWSFVLWNAPDCMLWCRRMHWVARICLNARPAGDPSVGPKI